MMLEMMILSAMINLIKCGCGPGCLKCNRMDQCVYCDIENKYYNKQNECQIFTHKQCAMYNIDGECLVCSGDYYFDKVVNICVEIPLSKKVQYCETYDSEIKCTRCISSFYLDNLKCTHLESSIPFCKYHKNHEKCLICENQYTISHDLQKCEMIQPILKCQHQSFLKCRNCLSGFVYDKNGYINQYNNPDYLMYLFFNSHFTSLWIRQTVCYEKNIRNCYKYENSTSCEECNKGYYIKNGECEKHSEVSIPNCLEYSDDFQCSKCVSKMYLISQNVCKYVSIIDNCLVYNQSSTKSECEECSREYYLSDYMICSQRLKSIHIADCMQYDLNDDKCIMCANDKITSNDGLKCINSIDYCKTHSVSDVLTQNVECLLCNEGLYLDNNKCKFGLILDCEVYVINSQKCLKCLNGSYLSNGFCIKHSPISNCLEYDQNKCNVCSKCISGYYPLLLETVCIGRQLIPECILYSNDGLTCLKCTQSHYLSDGKCTAYFYGFSYCLTYESPKKCLTCISPFMLFQNKCHHPFEYVTVSCLLMNTSESYNLESSPIKQPMCAVCKSNAIMTKLSQLEAICIKKSQLSLISNFLSIKNCLRYGINLSNYLVCMECIQGLYLLSYKRPDLFNVFECGVCPETNHLILLDDLFGSVNICVKIETDNFQFFAACRIAVRLTTVNFMNSPSSQSDDYICLKPTSGFHLTYTPPNALIYPIDQLDLSGSVIREFTHGYSTYQLNPSASIFNFRGFNAITTLYQSLITLIDNCDVYWLPGLKGTRGINPVTPDVWIPLNNAAYCMRCSFGFHRIAILNPSVVSHPVCISYNGLCASSYVMGGLASFLNGLLSCHYCYPSGSIPQFPTLYAEYGENGPSGPLADYNTIFQFSVNANSPLLTGNTCSPAIPVLSSGSQTMGGVGVNGPGMLSGCGAFGVITPVSANVAKPPISVCLACQYGYSPTYAIYSAVNFMPYWSISSCTVISQCDYTYDKTTFNGCTACLSTTTLGTTTFYAFTDWSLIKCEQCVTPFCFILVPGSSSSVLNSCSVCKTGHYLNYDGFCDKLSSPFGNSNQTVVFAYYSQNIPKWKISTGVMPNNADSLQIRIHYLLQYFSIQYGIRYCQSDYVASSVTIPNEGVCIVSFYMGSSYRIEERSAFIKNCINYNATSLPLKCFNCIDRHIPTIDGKTCVISTSNCKFAMNVPNTHLCAICLSNYLNSNGICSSKSIKNCVVYVNTETSSEMDNIQCEVCEDGYWMNANRNICLRGNIDNCKIYQIGKDNICDVCLDSYFVVQNVNSSYCFPIDKNTHCLNFINKSTTFACDKCTTSSNSVYGITPFYETISSSYQSNSICLEFNAISNCAEYDQYYPQLNSNTFKCVECEYEYFLDFDSQKCKLRKFLSSFCKIHEIRNDKCKECLKGYYLSSSDKLCKRYPIGIWYCSKYLNELICEECIAPYYVYSNTCIQSLTTIQHCLVYISESTCKKCVDGFYLTNPQFCEKIIARNCIKLFNATACLECPANYGLLQTNSTVDCILSNISNCKTVSKTFPFSCLQCDFEFFLNEDGVCIKHGNPISNCLYYASFDKCFQCKPQTVLSYDNSSCSGGYDLMIDHNCHDYILSNVSECTQCDFNHKFVNDKCQEYSSSLVNRGCKINNPSNSSDCWLCHKDYYQTKSGLCIYWGLEYNSSSDFILDSSLKLTKLSIPLIFLSFINFND